MERKRYHEDYTPMLKKGYGSKMTSGDSARKCSKRGTQQRMTGEAGHDFR